MSSLTLTFDLHPPSENDIKDIRWFNAGGKRKAAIGYTIQAESWKRKFSDAMRAEFFVQITRFRREHKPTDLYTVEIALDFEEADILNKTWLKGGKGKAKSPYKKVDGPNRNKLLLDAVAEVLDIDDSLFFEVCVRKFAGMSSALAVIIERADPTRFGIPPEYLEASDEG